ncbi:MAG: phosphatase PAP2 family protein [Halobacteriales archaeon]
MFRLVEASAAVRGAVPDELVPVFWVITALGSAKFLMVGLSLAYWNDDTRRRELLTLVSVAFVAVTLTLALKYGLDLPRPPESVRRYPVEPSPVGFPSGHAIAATTIYGGLLVVFDRYRDPKLLSGTAALVVLIGLSRVVLGVHYLGDILAGFAVGLVMLGVLAVAMDRGPAVVFGLAVVLAVPAVVVTTDTGDAALALGGSVGGAAAALWRTPVGRVRSTVERAVLNAGGLAFVGVSLAVVETVEALFVAAVAVNLVLVFGIVALPAAVGRLDALGTASATE